YMIETFQDKKEFDVTDIPPLIIALDFVDPADSIQYVENLVDLPRDLSKQIGIKIPRWHDQNRELRRTGLDSSRFVVLASQLDDGIEEMSMATRSLLSVADDTGRLLLPNAITMSPAKETVTGQRQATQEGIFDVAHNQE